MTLKELLTNGSKTRASTCEGCARLEERIERLEQTPAFRQHAERLAMEDRGAARAAEEAREAEDARAMLVDKVSAEVERSPWVIARLAPRLTFIHTRPGRHRASFVINLKTGPVHVRMRRSELDERLAVDNELRTAIADGSVLVETLPTADAVRLELEARRFA